MLHAMLGLLFLFPNHFVVTQPPIQQAEYTSPEPTDTSTKPKPKPKPTPKPKPKPKLSPNAPTYMITAYTAHCEGCSGITASGKRPVSQVTVACPPELKLGEWITIEGIGKRRCDDRGGAIKGRHIDLFMTYQSDALQFGKQYHDVYVN